MTEKIILAGSGGQGILTLGIFLSSVSIEEGKNSTWLPSYGAEKRGGFSFCNVVISDDEIFSPVVQIPDTLILFDERAVEKYRNTIDENTLIIENSSLIKDGGIKSKNKISIPAGDIAKKLGLVKIMNIVMAGVFVAKKKIFKLDSCNIVLEKILKGKDDSILNLNKKAILEGISFVEKMEKV